jgi:hypothetical protein
MYLALPVSSGRFTRALDVPNYSGIKQNRLINFDYRAITFFGVSFQKLHLFINFLTVLEIYVFNLQPHCIATPVWASLISLAAILRIFLFSFPVGTERFHFPTCALRLRCSSRYNLREFPHSEIPGSKPLGGSPRRIVPLLRPSSPYRTKASTIYP